MSYVLYRRSGCNVAFEKESSYRSGNITEGNALPFDIFEELEIPSPDMEFEEVNAVHGGRNVSNVGEKTYPQGEGSLETQLQSGIWFYYALGACATTGSGPYTHAITEADSLPSFKCHYEQLNTGTGNDIVDDLIGCLVSKLALSIKKEDLIAQTIDFLVPKSIAGSKFTSTTWSSFNLTDKIMNWDHAELTVFTVNSVNLLTTWGNIPMESVDITITNDIKLHPDLGDPYLNEAGYGKREYEVKIMLYPKDDTLKTARNLHPEDYTGALTFKISRDANDYIQLTFSDLYVSEYPKKIPNIDDKDVGVEVTFRNSPGGTLAVEVKDGRDISYYEVS